MGRGKNLIIVFSLVILVWPVLAESSPPKQWKSILTQIQTGNYQKGIFELKKLLESNPGPIWQKRVLFLLAYTYRQANELTAAKVYFTRAMEDYDTLKDYIEMELGKIWLAQGKPHRAYALIKSFSHKYPKSPLLFDAQLLGADALREMENYSQAIDQYREVIEGKGLENRRKEAEALFGWAESLSKIGQASQAWKLYSQIYFEYPEQALTDTSLGEMKRIDRHKVSTLREKSWDLYLKRAEKLMELGHYALALKDYEALLSTQLPQGQLEKVLLKKGFCLYSLRERTKATDLLKQFIDKHPRSPHIPEGLYYLAKLYWNMKDNYKAEDFVWRLVKTYPHEPWTEKGMLLLGLIREEEGKWPQATKVYRDMRREFPQGELLPEIHWREGWTEYVRGNYGGAAQAFKALLILPAGEELRDKAIYWHARALEKDAQEKEAQEFYEKLARDYFYSYYGVRGAERWLRGQKLKESFNFWPEDDSLLIPNDIAWNTDQTYYLERVKELTLLACYPEAQRELKYSMKALSPDTRYNYELAKSFYQNRFYYDTIKILSQILFITPVENRKKLPLKLWQLLYPPAYWSQVQRHAKQNQQDPYLIMAIIRQESAFQSRAISSSGACGLMQILPSTGKFIFQSLGKDGFQRQYLFDPDGNISLGIWYFKYLQDKFDQNLILALAGYNAGPERAKEWLKRYGMNDPDIFIENIPYRETQAYVKNILRNRFFYEQIYKTRGTNLGEE